jgi:antitoxin component YwqK of YwqJK toxin-antitoxin module
MLKTILNIIFILFIAIMTACQSGTEGNSTQLITMIPDINIDTESELLIRKRGVLYYEGLPFSGNITSWHKAGKLASRAPFLEGKEHGLSEAWYPNGTKQFERIYEYGIKTGIHKGWWETGQPKHIRHLANDVFEGSVKEWYASGQPFLDLNYVKGQEAGSQKAWKSDGRIKVNYVAKNGRKYGLTGVKNCISLVE